MTINGPAPMILAMFMNAAIDQQVEKYLKEDPKRGRKQKRRSPLYIRISRGLNTSASCLRAMTDWD